MKKLLALLASCSMFASVALGAGNTYTGHLIGYATAAQGLTNFSLSHILYVDKNGSDSNAVRGDFTHPWLTGSTASTVATNGDSIVFGPGTFGDSSPGLGVAVIGAGKNLTTAGTINIQTNNTVKNLTCTLITSGSQSGSGLFCDEIQVGNYSTYDCFLLSSATGVVINNSVIYGNCDIGVGLVDSVWNNDQINLNDSAANASTSGMHAFSANQFSTNLTINGGTVNMASVAGGPPGDIGQHYQNSLISLGDNGTKTNLVVRIYGIVFNHSSVTNPISAIYNPGGYTNIFGWYWDNSVLTYINGTNIYQPYNLGTFTGNGSGLTSLNAQSLTSIGNTNASYNFFIGGAGNSTNAGNFNEGFGNNVLANNGTGAGNVAHGYNALFSNISGSYNSAYGTSTLFNNTSGSYNTALGDLAGYNITTGSSNIDIFNNGLSTDTNIVRIGYGQSDTYLAGIVHGNGSGLTGLPSSGGGFAASNTPSIGNIIFYDGNTNIWGYQNTNILYFNSGVVSQPWVPANCLGKGDVIGLTNVYMLNGTNLVSCTNANFTAADVGKYMRVIQAWTTNSGSALGNLDLGCQITNVIDSHHVLVNSNALNTTFSFVNQTNLTGLTNSTVAYYGTDDSTNFQNAVNWCFSNHISTLHVSRATGFAGAFNMTNQDNAMIVLPDVPATQDALKLIIEGDMQPEEGTAYPGVNKKPLNPDLTSGTWCVMLVTGNGITSASNLYPAFLSAGTSYGPEAAGGVTAYPSDGFNNVSLLVRNIGFRFASNPRMSGFNLLAASNERFEHVTMDCSFPSYSGPDIYYGNRVFAIAASINGNNQCGSGNIDNSTFTGFNTSLILFEHSSVNTCFINCCQYAIYANNAAGFYPISGYNVNIQSSTHGITGRGGVDFRGFCFENALLPAYYGGFISDVYDTGNYLTGFLTFGVGIGAGGNGAGANGLNLNFFITVGGTNLTCSPLASPRFPAVNLGLGSQNGVILQGNLGNDWVTNAYPAGGTFAGRTNGPQSVATWTQNPVVAGTFTATNGFVSYASNTLALTSISFPATTVNWTNTFGKNIFVFIDNSGITGTALKINGAQISSTLLVTGDTIIPLQPGDYFSETYTVGTPSAVWKPQ